MPGLPLQVRLQRLVTEADEFARAHIPGALSQPLSGWEAAHLAVDPDADPLTVTAINDVPTLTAISNTRRGSGETREEESTAIQWTLWGKQAENAAEYLGKGSHVNIVGRLRNNNYEKDGETVYGMAFTAEEIDYLDSRADADTRRSSAQPGHGNQTASPARQASRMTGRNARQQADARA